MNKPPENLKRKMEGAWHSWRVQRIENNSPDLDSYGKPLPSPPPGFYWERLEDKSWELRKFEKQEQNEIAIFEFKAPTVIEHVVLDSDTLQGLCLRYRVSAVTLRQYNNFSGTSFKCKKYLRIPIEPGLPVQVQQLSRDVLLQRFKNDTGESEKEARCYLEESDWDIKLAIQAWRGDENWESEQLPLAVAVQSNTCVAPSAVVVPVAASSVRSGVYVPPRFVPMSMGEEEESQPLIS